MDLSDDDAGQGVTFAVKPRPKGRGPSRYSVGYRRLLGPIRRSWSARIGWPVKPGARLWSPWRTSTSWTSGLAKRETTVATPQAVNFTWGRSVGESVVYRHTCNSRGTIPGAKTVS